MEREAVTTKRRHLTPEEIARRLADGEKLLNLFEEFTREFLDIDVKCSITAEDVASLFDRLVAGRSLPCILRGDNGPESAAFEFRDWRRFNAWATVFVDPRSLWQNTWIKYFNWRLRNEFVSGQLFDSLPKARVIFADWRN